MIVVVNIPGRPRLQPEVDASMTVESFCVQLRHLSAIHPSVELTLYDGGGTKLEDHCRTLGQYNIMSESTIYVERPLVSLS
jgi:hypothetical protein